MPTDDHCSGSDRRPADMRTPDTDRAFVALLTAPPALGQLAVSLVVPLLPALATELGAPRAQGMVLSVFMAGFAVGQLVFGPLSDRFGRRPVLLAGLSLFTAAAAAAATAETFQAFLMYRLVQGSGAGAGLTVVRAAARDRFAGPQLPAVMAAMSMAMAVIPGVAPSIGGMLAERAGWRAALWLTCAAGVALFALLWTYLPETNFARVQRLSVRGLAVAYGTVFKERTFLGPVLMNAFCLAALYAFFAGAPGLFMGRFGFSPAAFGLLLLCTSLAYLVGAAVTAARPNHGAGLVRIGLAAMLAGTALNMAQGLAGLATATGYAAGVTAYAVGLGMILPIGVARALAPFSRQAGVAGALLGALHMGAGALGATLVAWLPGDNPTLTFPAVMFAAVAAAALWHLRWQRRPRVSSRPAPGLVITTNPAQPANGQKL